MGASGEHHLGELPFGLVQDRHGVAPTGPFIEVRELADEFD
jgi:hypothetical protein